jgi:O-antigen/teichoic acid export membrane protein
VKRFAQTTLWYTAVGLIGPIVALLLTPLYTRAIGVAGYGTVDIFLSLWQGAYTVALWGIGTVLAGMYSATNDAAQRRTIITSAGTVVVALGLVIGAGLLVCAPLIGQAIARPETDEAMPYLVGALPFAVVYTLLLSVFKLRNDVRLVVWSMIGLIGFTAATRIALVIWWDGGVVGMIQAAALTNVLMALLTIGLGWSLVGRRVDIRVIKTVLRTGLPLLPVSITGWVVLYADRWLLAPQVDALALGHYALAVLVASLLAFVIEPLKNAWQPIALQPRYRDDDVFLALSFRLYIPVALLIVGVLVLCAPTLLWIIGGAAAQPAAPYVLALTCMPLFGGVQVLLGLRAVRDGRTAVFGWGSLIAALLNLGVNIAFIPMYGVAVAAWGTALAAGVATVILGLRERETLRVVAPLHEVWPALLWFGLLWWWGVGGPTWWGLLALVVTAIGLVWSAVQPLRTLSLRLKPELDDTGATSEVVVQDDTAKRKGSL